MGQRAAKNTGEQPYYLAAPVGWQTAMEVKRRFADSDPPIPVVGGASVDAAIARLEANPRCVAVLIHFAEQPQAAIELICRIKERWRRPVVCFHPAWHRDDVRRALQLGADSLLGWPFEPGEVLGDLEALHKMGVSVTRKALLDQGGADLLAPDPGLWVDTDGDWRDRLSGLAERLRTPAAEEQGRVTRIDPAANFNRALGGAMTPALAGATMTVMRVGTQHLPDVAGEYGVDPSQLQRSVEVGMQVPDDGRREGVLAWLEELARSGGDEADNGVMAQLRRAAQVTLQAGGERSGEIDVLANALSRAIGVPVGPLSALSPAVRTELSNRVLSQDEADDTLDQVRMLVLASLLEGLGARTPSAHDLAALTALLGLRAGVEGVRPAELVRALARLDPPSALHRLDLRRLAPVREVIPNPGNALDQLLRRAIDELLKAVAPMGYVDQTRLVGLLRAARQGGTVLVGPTTWRTVLEVIAGRRTGTDARAVKIRARLDRLMAVGGTDARGRLVRALNDLIERSRNPMDAARFVGWCRDAAAGVIQTESVAGRVDPNGGALAGLDRSSDGPPRADEASLYADSPRPSTSGSMRTTGPQIPQFAESPPAGRGPTPPAVGPGGASAGPASGGFDPTAMLGPSGATPVSGAFERAAANAPPEGARPTNRDFDPTAMLAADGPPPAAGATPRANTGSMAGERGAAGGAAGSQMPDWLDPGDGAPPGPGGSPRRSSSPSRAPVRVEVPPSSPALDAINALVQEGQIDLLAARAADFGDDEPGVADALNRAALELYVSDRRAEADALWTRAAALVPERPNVLFSLARLRHEQGRIGEARHLIRQVLALRPHLTPARTLRAQLERG